MVTMSGFSVLSGTTKGAFKSFSISLVLIVSGFGLPLLDFPLPLLLKQFYPLHWILDAVPLF